MTEFAKQLKEYFPELGELYEISKRDNKVKRVLDSMVEMDFKKNYGELRIVYQQGKINRIYFTEQRNV